MGISSLLPLLSSYIIKTNISRYQYQKIGIDGYAWLYKSCFHCSYEISNNIETNKYIDSIVKKMEILLQFNIVPIFIFDGNNISAKKETELGRKENKAKNLVKANELYKDGKKSEAYQYYQKSYDITPLLASKLISVLKNKNIECIVAPYEADAQLTYLSQNNYIDVVLSEDSDMLAFGCKKVLFKFDSDGNGDEIELNKLFTDTKSMFYNWTHDHFLQMCILTGCDYLPSIPGIGPKTAYNYINQTKSYELALRRIRFDGKLKIPSNYLDNFKLALETFRHQRVYDVVRAEMTYLHPLTKEMIESGRNLDHLGVEVENSIATEIANGIRDPITKEYFDLSNFSFQPTVFVPKSASKSKSKDSSISNFFAAKPKSPRKKSPTKLNNDVSHELFSDKIEIKETIRRVESKFFQTKDDIIKVDSFVTEEKENIAMINNFDDNLDNDFETKSTISKPTLDILNLIDNKKVSQLNTFRFTPTSNLSIKRSYSGYLNNKSPKSSNDSNNNLNESLNIPEILPEILPKIDKFPPPSDATLLNFNKFAYKRK